MALKHQLKQGLSSLPKPKQTEWEFDLPEEQESLGDVLLSEEDAEVRDRRNRETKEAQELLERKRQTQVMQRDLPRPSVIDIGSLLAEATKIDDPIQQVIERESALLIANDALKYPISSMKVKGTASAILESFDDDSLARARQLVAAVAPKDMGAKSDEAFETAWNQHHKSSLLPGLAGYADDEEVDEKNLLSESFDVCYICRSHFHVSSFTNSSAENTRLHCLYRRKRE
jgi:pre-mRNA-splicing factor CDC5/CEF1